MIVSRKTKLQLCQRMLAKITIVEEKTSFFEVQEKNLFVLLLFMPEDFIYKSSFTVQCEIGNKISEIILVDTCATRYSFIDEKFTEIVC